MAQSIFCRREFEVLTYWSVKVKQELAQLNYLAGEKQEKQIANMENEKKAHKELAAEEKASEESKENDCDITSTSRDEVNDGENIKGMEVEMVRNLENKDKDKAAVKIQSAYKGFRSRKRVAKMRNGEARDGGKKKVEGNEDEKRREEELKSKEGRDERARKLKEKLEKIDDDELKYKQERRRKLKEEESLSIFEN